MAVKNRIAGKLNVLKSIKTSSLDLNENIQSDEVILQSSECRYYDIDEIKDHFGNNAFQYKALHLNIRSLPKHIDDLKLLVRHFDDSGCSLDFILLSETFLTEKNCQLFDIPGYSKVEKHRKNTVGGGVALYIKNDFQFQVRDDLSFYEEGKY